MDSQLSALAHFAIRCVVTTLVWFSTLAAAWLLLSTFLWAWLAWILACVGTVAVCRAEPVRAANARASDLAVAGAERTAAALTKASGWLGSLASKLAK